MKRSFLTTIIGILLFNLSNGQNMDDYKYFILEADEFYNMKEYAKSASKYKDAFESNEGKAYPNDRYNAACSYALAKNSEKAFYHLFRLAEHPQVKYQSYNHITNDTDLNYLHTNKEWGRLIKLIKANKDEAEKNLDKSLVTALQAINEEDQKYRKQLGAIEKEFGRGSDELKKHWDIINEKDSINLIKVQKILDERGWLGQNIVGGIGNSTLFLVIQHADIKTQQKYLPMMREAVKKGNAQAGSLALLEDRVALRTGEKQIYGSQIGRDQDSGEFFVSPLIDPENVNERRANVGLGSIESYIKNWNMTWDVKKHIERSEKTEKEKK